MGSWDLDPLGLAVLARETQPGCSRTDPWPPSVCVLETGYSGSAQRPGRSWTLWAPQGLHLGFNSRIQLESQNGRTEKNLKALLAQNVGYALQACCLPLPLASALANSSSSLTVQLGWPLLCKGFPDSADQMAPCTYTLPAFRSLGFNSSCRLLAPRLSPA